MKKTILSLGKALNRAEQKEIFGGFGQSNVPHISGGGGSLNRATCICDNGDRIKMNTCDGTGCDNECEARGGKQSCTYN